MTEPKTEDPIQYRSLWHVAGYTGQERIHVRILLPKL